MHFDKQHARRGTPTTRDVQQKPTMLPSAFVSRFIVTTMVLMLLPALGLAYEPTTVPAPSTLVVLSLITGFHIVLIAWMVRRHAPSIRGRFPKRYARPADQVPMVCSEVFRTDGRGLPLGVRTKKSEINLRIVTAGITRISAVVAVLVSLAFFDLAVDRIQHGSAGTLVWLVACFLLAYGVFIFLFELASPDVSLRREVQIGADDLVVETQRGILLRRSDREHIPIGTIARLSTERLSGWAGFVPNPLWSINIETSSQRKIGIASTLDEAQANLLVERLHDRLFTVAGIQDELTDDSNDSWYYTDEFQCPDRPISQPP